VGETEAKTKVGEERDTKRTDTKHEKREEKSSRSHRKMGGGEQPHAATELKAVG